jgi:hypothetical protein
VTRVQRGVWPQRRGERSLVLEARKRVVRRGSSKNRRGAGEVLGRGLGIVHSLVLCCHVIHLFAPRLSYASIHHVMGQNRGHL